MLPRTRITNQSLRQYRSMALSNCSQELRVPAKLLNIVSKDSERDEKSSTVSTLSFKPM